jgi:hypothetical protein
MQRALYVWATAGLLLLSAGCSMCGHPYDYCGPVAGDGNCMNCDTRTRSGSILAPTGAGVVQSGEVQPGQVIQEGAPSGEVIYEGPAITEPLSGNAQRSGQWTAQSPRTVRR